MLTSMSGDFSRGLNLDGGSLWGLGGSAT